MTKKKFDALAGANTLPSEDLAVMTGQGVEVVVMGDYDYGKLDRELARWAEGEEAAIKRELASMEGDLDAIETHRRAIANHETNAVEGALSIGKRLAAVKAKLPHGEFQPWVKAAFETATGLSYRTAVRWMGIAEQFGHRPELVSEMGIKVAGLLATRLDDGEADAVLAAVEDRLGQGEKLTPAAAKQLKAEVQGTVDTVDESKPVLASKDDWADALDDYICTVALGGDSTLKQRYDTAIFMHQNGTREQKDAFSAAHAWILMNYRTATEYDSYWWQMDEGRHILVGRLLRWLIEQNEGVQVEPVVVTDAELFARAVATYSADKLALSKNGASLRGVFEYDGRLWVGVGGGPYEKSYRVHPEGEVVEPGMPSRGNRHSYLGLKATYRGKTYTFGSQELHVYKPKSEKTAVAPSEDPASPNTHAQHAAAQTAVAAQATDAVTHYAGWVRHVSERIIEALQEQGDVEICLDVHAVLERAAKFLEARNE